jgi:hypothetical protein
MIEAQCVFSDNEQKLDELSRKLGVQEDELRRAAERAELAESRVKDIEHELETGEIQLNLVPSGKIRMLYSIALQIVPVVQICLFTGWGKVLA